jgi:2-oxoglutarate ferredoxin oxidoreductase subunit gamma
MAGAIVGEAATRTGLVAACSSSYGSQARGGVTRSDVIVVRAGLIDFPHVSRPDLLAVMNDESYRAFLPSLAASGVVLADPHRVDRDRSDPRPHHEVEATRIAADELGKVQSANVVMLGAVVGLTALCAEEHVRAAVREAFGDGAFAVNDEALRIGLELGRALAGER